MKNRKQNEEGQETRKDSRQRGQKVSVQPSTMKRLCGFNGADFTSWEAFQKLLHRPTDPAALGMLRFVYGFLMVLDIPQERGLAHADYKWGDPDECRFPLFNFLAPLPLEWMYIVYLLMWIGAIGIMLGLFFRASCLMFACTYWYIFLLDKTVWNNHSYLYGLCSILLMFSDANRYWSVDGLLKPHKRNAHVPLWNYTLVRAQFFLVYFIAGLKKLDADWVKGYSMQRLSHHWVFEPFTWVLPNDQIDLWIVHRGGLAIDLFIGYILFFDKTRPIGFIFGGMFHLMNSQMFSIGMFPWMMLGTMPIFCHADWPKWLCDRVMPGCLRPVLPLTADPQHNPRCIYHKEAIKPEEVSSSKKKAESAKPARPGHSSPQLYHQLVSLGCIAYLASQCFLPYSHFLTKGYNNWTNGLYGYSWDMMVHSWSTQHLRITYLDKQTGKTGYLNPEAWTRGSKRWCAHADMVKQYAHCIQERLLDYNLTEVELYFDVWRSLNDRFQQRMFDPQVDILTAEWHPFKATSWLKPLLTELSDWRQRLDEMEKQVYDKSNITDVTFIADFPGLTLENFVQGELNDTKLLVLSGTVDLELPDSGKVITLTEGQESKVPASQFHNVHTVSETPSCLMYVFRNTTEEALHSNLTDYEQEVQKYEKTTKNASDMQGESPQTDPNHPEQRNPELARVWEQVKRKRQQVERSANLTAVEKAGKFIRSKYRVFVRGLTMVGVAVQSILTQESFEVVFNSTVGHEGLDFEEQIMQS